MAAGSFSRCQSLEHAAADMGSPIMEEIALKRHTAHVCRTLTTIAGLVTGLMRFTGGCCCSCWC